MSVEYQFAKHETNNILPLIRVLTFLCNNANNACRLSIVLENHCHTVDISHNIDQGSFLVNYHDDETHTLGAPIEHYQSLKRGNYTDIPSDILSQFQLLIKHFTLELSNHGVTLHEYSDYYTRYCDYNVAYFVCEALIRQINHVITCAEDLRVNTNSYLYHDEKITIDPYDIDAYTLYKKRTGDVKSLLQSIDRDDNKNAVNQRRFRKLFIQLRNQGIDFNTLLEMRPNKLSIPTQTLFNLIQKEV